MMFLRSISQLEHTVTGNTLQVFNMVRVKHVLADIDELCICFFLVRQAYCPWHKFAAVVSYVCQCSIASEQQCASQRQTRIRAAGLRMRTPVTEAGPRMVDVAAATHEQ